MADEPATLPKILVLGGARSGKSGFAQEQAEASGRTCVFIATAEASDGEMRERIARHVEARGPGWRTLEAPYDLCAVVRAEAEPSRIVLVDCLTVWLSNVMLRGEDTDAAITDLIGTIGVLTGPILFVSNEVGAGIVPDNALARRFRDAHGCLNQRVATVCDTVILVTAGLARVLKPGSPPRLGL